MAVRNRSLLNDPPFRYFWLARVLSVLAYQMTTVALAWQVYELTNSALALGLIGLAQFFPIIVLTLPIGHLSDQYNRSTIIRITQIVCGSAGIILILGTASPWLNTCMIYIIYAVVATLGAMRAFEAPNASAIVPNLVPTQEVSRAMAWYTSANKAAQIIGPAIGGGLYAFGPAWVYSISSLMWILGSLVMGRITVVFLDDRREPPTLRSLLAGFDFVLRNRVILGIISLDLFAVLFGGATALLPIFARDVLHAGPWGLGLLRSAPAVGAFITSLSLAHYTLRPPVGPILFAVTIVFGIATIIFALSTHMILSLAALCVMGAADVVSVVIRFSLVQLRTPEKMRGRVSAVNSLFTGTSNQLGDFESGLVAAFIGAVPAAVLGGVGTIAVAVIWMLLLFPPLMRIHRLEGDDTADADAS